MRPSSGGMLPVRRLFESASHSKLLQFARVGGMVPLMRFTFSTSSHNLLAALQMLLGISCSRKLPHMTISCRLGMAGNGVGKPRVKKLQLTSIATRLLQLSKGTVPDNSLSASSNLRKDGTHSVPGILPLKEFALRSSTCKAVELGRDTGRGPVKLLKLRIRVWRAGIWPTTASGKSPVSLLSPKFKYLREEQLAREMGIDPTRLLADKSSTFSCRRHSPRLAGMEPVRLFLERERTSPVY